MYNVHGRYYIFNANNLYLNYIHVYIKSSDLVNIYVGTQ